MPLSCPACDSQSFLVLPALPLHHGGNWISLAYRLCRNCGLVFLPVDPERLASLNEEYRHFNRKNMPAYTLAKRPTSVMRQEFIISNMPGGLPKTMLDIGSGDGSFVKLFQDAGWQACGIEPAMQLATFSREHHGIDIVNEFFHPDLFPANSLSLITLNRVLEHTSAPRHFLADLRTCLADDGCLFLDVPLPCYASVNPQHLALFTEKSLANLLSVSGFQPLALTTVHWFNGAHTGVVCLARKMMLPGDTALCRTRPLSIWLTFLSLRLKFLKDQCISRTRPLS